MHSTDDEKLHLEKSPLCQNCSAHCRSAFHKLSSNHSSMIDAIREMKTYECGQKIDPQADGSENFFCIYKGHVKIELGDERNQKSVRICGPGDLVGLKMNGPYSIQTLDEVTICMIEARAFRELQLKVPEISIGIIENLVKTLSAKDEQIKGLENHAVKNRIAATLALLAKKFGVIDQENVLIDLSIDRKTLSQLSGTVVESLARVLTELEEDQVIRRQGRKIKILNLAKLLDISNS